MQVGELHDLRERHALLDGAEQVRIHRRDRVASAAKLDGDAACRCRHRRLRNERAVAVTLEAADDIGTLNELIRIAWRFVQALARADRYIY